MPKNQLGQISLNLINYNWSTFTSSIILHFCALISLVSISQVRSFITFHLILLSKISNIYSSLIQTIANSLLSVQATQDKNKKIKIKTLLNKVRANKATQMQFISQYNKRAFGMSHTKGAKVPSVYIPQKRLLTYFSINLLKKYSYGSIL